MRAKIVAAVAMPVIAATLVGGVLKVTHHTTVPPLAIPVAPPAGSTPDSSTPINPGPCMGKVPKRFAGIAVSNDIRNHVADFEKITSTKVQIVEFYNPFVRPFASAEAGQVIEAGQLPLIQLNPRNVSEQQIADGKYDSHLRAYAHDVKKFGCAVILSFGHEMNGWWYPWGAPVTSPASFISAWRHIHDIFHSQGVRNVIWSWDPSHQYSQFTGKIATPASEWYPGGKYVDWIGIDGYIGHDRNGQPQNFQEIFGFQLHDIRKIAPHKLIYLAETGVAPGPAAVGQIANLFREMAAYHVSGLVWFDVNAKQPWRLEGRPAADAAYRKNLAAFLR